jgi:hypothetical protein
MIAVVPPPGSDLISIVPPSFSMIDLEMARPSPVPLSGSLVV